MSAIAYYLEDEGIATTGISLVRENTAALRPPRFLWVSFPLGRPLGTPGDAAFQHRVIKAALDLFGCDAGPVLEDYPEDVPPGEAPERYACPISLARPPRELGTWEARLRQEIGQLQPWYDLSRRRRGRTTVGISGSSIAEIVTGVTAVIDRSGEAVLDVRWLKLAVEDLKAFYQEAVMAQPGDHPWAGIRRWLWRETELGKALIALGGIYSQHENRAVRRWVRGLMPRYATETCHLSRSESGIHK